ncbi:hypothetical protein PCANB_002038 [Pneumocystis canis]|nr:hypothetical protein PCANB_002038 [Pneumocystis canis]
MSFKKIFVFSLNKSLLSYPLSLLRFIFRIFIRLQAPCRGTLDISSTSVHVNDALMIERLWNGGFFGKGSLSRSSLSWRTRIQRLLGLIGPNESLTSEERTFQRRQARLAFKQRRARLEKGFDNDELGLGVRVNNLDIHNIYETNSITAMSLLNLEYLQLHLEEAFFLSYALGILKIDIKNNIPIKTSMDLLLLFCFLSIPNISIKSLIQQVQPDNPFLISYVAYHHYRSLGWVVRSGVKFSVNWLLYKQGPVFSHSEFAVILLPSYPDEIKGKKEPSWHWLHCINRVISQVKKV